MTRLYIEYAPSGKIKKLTYPYRVVQLKNGDWYIVGMISGVSLGGPYSNEGQADAALELLCLT